MLERMRDQDDRGLVNDIVRKHGIGQIATRRRIPIQPAPGRSEHRDDAKPLIAAVRNVVVNRPGQRQRLTRAAKFLLLLQSLISGL